MIIYDGVKTLQHLLNISSTKLLYITYLLFFTAERLLKLAEDFSKTFRSVPTFGIFWMNTFSHNYINSPTRMDDKMRDFFENLKINGIFNHSVVNLLSDHGIRFGDIRKTIQGWYEERLPTNLISIPPWFQKQFPEKYSNFLKNSKKLTSTYDLYMTLEEILHLSVTNHNISRSEACPSCLSLFSDIPENRSCKEAGIPELWCTCVGMFEKNSTKVNNELTDEAIEIVLANIEDIPLHQYKFVNNVLLSSINSGNEDNLYFLVIFEINYYMGYQALFRLNDNPIRLGNMVKVIRIY